MRESVLLLSLTCLWPCSQELTLKFFEIFKIIQKFQVFLQRRPTVIWHLGNAHLSKVKFKEPHRHIIID
jgi:hypothetical protein